MRETRIASDGMTRDIAWAAFCEFYNRYGRMPIEVAYDQLERDVETDTHKLMGIAEEITIEAIRRFPMVKWDVHVTVRTMEDIDGTLFIFGVKPTEKENESL